MWGVWGGRLEGRERGGRGAGGAIEKGRTRTFGPTVKFLGTKDSHVINGLISEMRLG